MREIGIYTWHDDPAMDREFWVAGVTDQDEARQHALLALRNDPEATRVLVANSGRIIIDYVQQGSRPCSAPGFASSGN